MRKSLLGMAFATVCGLFAATPASAADYYAPPPPMPVYQAPVQPCCCPTVRRGIWVSPVVGCGSYQPYAQPAYYAPSYAPRVGVAVGVGYDHPRRHCWRHNGHWVCR